jgi:metal-sulfur cluster biosynthetic enzyme
MLGVDESAVRRALDRIVDPCSVAASAPAGLDSMGLVRDVVVRPGDTGARVAVRIAVTEPNCVMGPSFLASAREVLAAMEGVADVDVSLDDAGDWSPADMDPAYATRLADVRRQRLDRLARRDGARGRGTR